MTYKSAQKVPPKYFCPACDYTTSHLSHWTKHTSTRKHKILTNDLQIGTKSAAQKFACEWCDKCYKHRQSLHNHRKKCNARPSSESAEVLSEAEPGGEPGDMAGLSKEALLGIIKDMIPRVGNQNTNINVQVFLDERCKDAMTIQNFATRLTMTIDDILAHQQKGLSAGVSNILLENLRPIPLLERPIHCTDVSGAKWMVHDETDGWKADTGQSVVKEAGFGINRRFQDLWNAAYPNWQYDEALQRSWIELVRCLNADPTDKDIETTLRRLGPECKLTAQDIRGIGI